MSTLSESGQVSSPRLDRVPVLKEGYLFKRQRGQSANADLRKLIFQKKYICLTKDVLQYYANEKVG